MDDRVKPERIWANIRPTMCSTRNGIVRRILTKRIWSQCHHFAMDFAARMHERITAISEEFMAALVHHSWPGNVRELQNFIERAVILSTGIVLSGSLPELTHTTQDGSRWLKASAPATLEQAERFHILQALQQAEV